MEIVTVSTHEGRRFVPVKGWDSVTNALNTFANGATRDAKATERVTTNDISAAHGANGGMAVGMFLLGGAIASGRNSLVERLLIEAKESLGKRSVFSKHYDYDGLGTSFFKTSVDIKILDPEEDMYGIALNAAYVGDEPERGLAEHFEIPRALMSCSVTIETKPVTGNRFEFDFEPVVRALDAVLETKKVTGKKIAVAMLEEHDSSHPSFVLWAKDGLEVRIMPGRVQERMHYVRSKGENDTWSVKDSVLSGELARDWSSDDENVKHSPTFVISVTSSKKDDCRGSQAIWQPELQQKAIALAERIAAALK